jgi:hypothetical protein
MSFRYLKRNLIRYFSLTFGLEDVQASQIQYGDPG